MSDKKNIIDNEGFKDFIEHEKEKTRTPRKDNPPVDLMPFIQSEMDRINKVAKLFTKLKQHQIYPHLDGLVRAERKKNLILEKKIFEKLCNENSVLLKNIELMARDLF